MTQRVYKLYDFFPELSDLYFLLKPSLTMKTQVRIRECILGNELIKYLHKCDNFLISRHAILYWVLKIIQGKVGLQNTPKKRFYSLAS